MALFVNPGKDWEKNMSEEDIAQMESQGYDVTELRAKRAKSAEEEEKERLREKEERENFKNPTNLNKLAPYLQTPRDMYNPQIEMFARFKMKSSFHKTKRII